MFAQVLREMRRQNNLTQSELAEGLDVSQQTVARWESGASMPSLETMVRIAAFFKASLSQFLGSNEDAIESLEWKRQEQDEKKKKIGLAHDIISIVNTQRTGENSYDCYNIDVSEVTKILDKNDDVMILFTTCLTALVEAIYAAALSLSKLDVDKAIASVENKPYNLINAIEEMTETLNRQVKVKERKIEKAFDLLPQVVFNPLLESINANRKGETDAQHNEP